MQLIENFISQYEGDTLQRGPPFETLSWIISYYSMNIDTFLILHAAMSTFLIWSIDMAADVRKVMADTGHDKACIVGHSLVSCFCIRYWKGF